MRVSLRDWFRLNLEIGALSVGGSGRILLYQDAVVRDRAWMTHDEFQEALTLAQVLPGPNLVNLSAYLGLALSGRLAAALGVLALGLPGALLVVAAVSFLPLDQPDVRLVFQGFSMGSVALFLVFLARLYRGLWTGARVPRVILRLAIVAGAAGASWAGLPLLWTLLVAGGVGYLIEREARL